MLSQCPFDLVGVMISFTAKRYSEIFTDSPLKKRIHFVILKFNLLWLPLAFIYRVKGANKCQRRKLEEIRPLIYLLKMVVNILKGVFW